MLNPTPQNQDHFEQYGFRPAVVGAVEGDPGTAIGASEDLRLNQLLSAV